jgi:hypothetical protein
VDIRGDVLRSGAHPPRLAVPLLPGTVIPSHSVEILSAFPILKFLQLPVCAAIPGAFLRTHRAPALPAPRLLQYGPRR